MATFIKSRGRQPVRSNEYREMGMEIEYLLSRLKMVKSLKAYYDNGYRQWGTIHSQFVGMGKIAPRFSEFSKNVRKVEEQAEEVGRLTRRGSKASVQFIQRLAWDMEDLSNSISTLYAAISESGVMQSPLAAHEMVCGSKDGRRLGIAQIFARSWSAANDMSNAIRELQRMCDEAFTSY